VVAGDLDQDQQDIVANAKLGARDDHSHRLVTGFIMGGAVCVVGLFVVVLLLFSSNGDLRNQIGTVSSQQQSSDRELHAALQGEQALASQVRDLGARPVVQPPATPAAGPTQPEIDAAVAQYLAAHPPGPTPAEVGLAVAEYLVANPPAAGPPPTPDEIATAAADYIAAHATQFAGQPGQNGANASDAQVASAVDAYCSAHGNCAGTAGQNGTNGTQGAQGVSITDLVFQRDSSGACQAVVTLHDPATGTDSTVTHPAGDAACPITATSLLHPGK
jgi:hypothetical protein